MEKLIKDFGAQMKQAVEIGEGAVLTAPVHPIHNVCLIGMGGSAFGGEVIKNLISSTCPVPFDIVRDYTIPGYVSQHTLLIVSSYSGNTEETLAALDGALGRLPKVVCITSGGKVLDLAKRNGFDHIVVPGGYPPRTAAGFSIIQQLFILRGMGLIADFTAALAEAIELVATFDAHDEAMMLAEQLHGKIPVIYSTPIFESASIRWRQQIEENSKHIAFHHVVPEMNHNELVGWKNPEALLDDTVLILLRSELDHPRNTMRMDIVSDLVGEYSDAVIEVPAQGESHLAQLFYLMHLGDWVSYYLAILNKEDPTPVEVIDFLKNELAKR